MSCSDSTTYATTTNTATTTTKIEIPLVSKTETETERLFKAQENIPVACEESVSQYRLRWNRRDSAQSTIRAAGTLTVVAVILITTVVAVSTGDASKLATATLALKNFAQALALSINGTSSSQESVF